MRPGPYRDGRVHVLAERCPTCIFRPGNPMRLEPGRVREMVGQAVQDDSAITCHSTIYEPGILPAICRGFYDAHRTTPLQLAERLGLLVEDPPPTKR